MLAPLKTLEEKLSTLIAYTQQLRHTIYTLQMENAQLREQNQLLADKMAHAQTQIDLIIHQIEQSDSPTSAS